MVNMTVVWQVLKHAVESGGCPGKLIYYIEITLKNTNLFWQYKLWVH
jgi:hypothetical protein